MAQVAISGKVTGKQGEPAVTIKELGSNGFKVAEFSVVDTEYFYHKGDDKPGQFYRVRVTGKQAEWADQLERGDFLYVTGQLVAKVFNDKTYLNIEDARYNAPRKEGGGSGGGASLF